jgi:hypothetical protein
MRFEVPQFIEIEDKIVGPLTWKQFVYIAGGAGILVVLFLTLPFIFFVILGLPTGALSGSLAFHRINNRPFSIFLEAFFNYFTKTKLYLWRKDVEQSVIGKSESAETSSASILDMSGKKSLSSLSRKLDLHTIE